MALIDWGQWCSGKLKVPRLFFAGCIGDTSPSVRYLVREEKQKFGEGL